LRFALDCILTKIEPRHKAYRGSVFVAHTVELLILRVAAQFQPEIHGDAYARVSSAFRLSDSGQRNRSGVKGRAAAA
jgi:hypothetical protein